MTDIIDLGRYPLDKLESVEGRALINDCQRALSRDGMFNLPGLIQPKMLRQMVNEVLPVTQSSGFTHQRRHNVYFLPEIEGLEPEHPALTEFETANQTVCADQIPDSALIELYLWPPLADFLATVMRKPALYPMDDPLACLNVMAYRSGQALNWHFDRSEFTITLLLQAPAAGGAFEYRTGLRSDRDPNYEGVGEFLRHKNPDRKKLVVEPGTLNVFRGRHTLHRVTQIQGSRDRIVSVLSYYQYEGARFSDEENLGFYGRKAYEKTGGAPKPAKE
tara:strand:+ start:1128 stop:1955 length:828 start_codon:yes stop_codon:yes gene_type:complete